MNFPTLSIISFDRTPDAAARERAEDRALNTILRQRGIRSEIFRLSLAPTEQEVSFLREILSTMADRPMAVVLREIAAHASQQSAVHELTRGNLHVALISVACDSAELFADLHYKNISVASDDAVATAELVERLSRWLVGLAD